MGVYIYRVTAQLVKLSDGGKAHVAKFAYKPFNWDIDANARMHFKSGCTASQNMNLKSDRIVTIDEDTGTGTLWDNLKKATVFSDDSTFGNPERMPKVANIRLEGKVWKIEEKV
jgi:hypothetical protein